MLASWAAVRAKLPNPSVEILIASKGQDLERMIALAEELDENARVFGENYPSELISKLERLSLREARIPGLRVNLIGHLQTNKITKILKADAKYEYLKCVQSIDCIRTVTKLKEAVERYKRRLEVLIQVNLEGRNSNQSGCQSTEAIEEIIDYIERECAACLECTGFMVIAERDTPPEASFQRARDTLLPLLASRRKLPITLSMGMSEDYEAAAACGATQVRIGRSIMGARAV